MTLYWVRSNNFGDALSPVIYQFVTGRKVAWSDEPPRVLAIGSIAHVARRGDTLWGTGAMCEEMPPGDGVRAVAVRGPLTDALLDEPCGVYGDPALLLPTFHPVQHAGGRVGIVPHYTDRGMVTGEENVIDPFLPWETIVERMTKCDLIVSSSLHGVVVAEAYGVPAVWAEFSDHVAGSGFKFRDYYLATGRDVQPVDMRGGVRLGGLSPPDAPQFDLSALMGACPGYDWRARSGSFRARIEIVAGMIEDGESVVDIGCGEGVLREYVTGGYVGVDKAHADITCDLNGELPTLPKCDVAVMTGALEFLDDVPRVIEWVKQHADVIVLSYAVGGDRKKNGWVNDYEEGEMMEMVGGCVERRSVWREQVVVRVSQP